MTTPRAIDIVRGKVPDLSEEETMEAWQLLVDNGVIWRIGIYYSNLAACYISKGKINQGAVI